GDVVAAAPDRHLEPCASRELERGDHVSSGAAADDQRRAAVDETVVDGTGLVVARVARGDDEPGDLPRERTDPAIVQRRAHVIEPFPFVVPPSSPDRPPGASAVAEASKATRQPYVGRAVVRHAAASAWQKPRMTRAAECRNARIPQAAVASSLRETAPALQPHPPRGRWIAVIPHDRVDYGSTSSFERVKPLSAQEA